MNSPSLVYCRTRGDAKEVCKCLHRSYKVDCTELFPIHEPGKHEDVWPPFKIEEEKLQIKVTKNFFGNRIVNV